MARSVFLFDVDNTLLDNDRVIADLRRYLDREVGAGRRRAVLRVLRGAAAASSATPTTWVRSSATGSRHPRDPHLLAVSSFLVNYPFANRLFPGSLDAIEHVAAFGPDGHPLRRRRGLPAAQGRALGALRRGRGRVLIYIHKEHELDDVERRYPAEHYVLVDDKLRILTAVKQLWGERVTTVFPRQGHYAHAADVASVSAARHHHRAHRRPGRLRFARAARRIAGEGGTMTEATHQRGDIERCVVTGTLARNFLAHRSSSSISDWVPFPVLPGTRRGVRVGDKHG